MAPSRVASRLLHSALLGWGSSVLHVTARSRARYAMLAATAHPSRLPAR